MEKFLSAFNFEGMIGKIRVIKSIEGEFNEEVDNVKLDFYTFNGRIEPRTWDKQDIR